MGGAYSTHGKNENYIENINLNAKDNFKYLMKMAG
jgi:hypothetical protein